MGCCSFIKKRRGRFNSLKEFPSIAEPEQVSSNKSRTREVGAAGDPLRLQAKLHHYPLNSASVNPLNQFLLESEGLCSPTWLPLRTPSPHSQLHEFLFSHNSDGHLDNKIIISINSTTMVLRFQASLTGSRVLAMMVRIQSSR